MSTSTAQSSYFVDSHLVEVLVGEALAGRYRWAKGLGWMEWDAVRWASCPEQSVVEAARQWAAGRLDTAVVELRTGKAPNDAEVRRWLSVASVGRVRSLVSFAQGVAGIATDAAAFDANPDLLNTPSGVVELSSGALLPHDPGLLLTRCTGVGYVRGATHPDWAAALAALPPDCAAYVQLRYGQAITGHMTPDDVLLVQVGAGENGKSTVMNAIAAALGDYAVHVSDRVLLGHPGDHPTELMDLRGARLATAEETPEARQLSVARLKTVIGTPMITARRIRQDPVTFAATHTLFLSTNYTPIVAETDHGTWRRLLLLRYPYRFRKAHEALERETDRPGDPGLRDRLRTDTTAAMAVLAWLVDGAVIWYALHRTLPEPPPRIVADTRAWRAEADQILAYVDAHLVADPGSHVMASELLAAFNAWLSDLGQHSWSDKLFASRFSGHDSVSGRVEKRKVRHSDRLSRPESRWQVPRPSVPETYAAWVGVRFQTAPLDAIAESPQAPKTGDVPAVPGASYNGKIQSLTGVIR